MAFRQFYPYFFHRPGPAAVLTVLFILTGNLAAPRSDWIPINHAEEYRDLWVQGEYRAALEALENEMATRPELADSLAYRYLVWLSDRAGLRFELGMVDEAIADLETIVPVSAEPMFLLRLARLYQVRGRLDDYKALLQAAAGQRIPRGRFYSQEQNLLAYGQLAELQGESPKRLLSSLYKSLMEQLPDFAAGFTGAGDLAQRNNAFDLAAQYYTSALRLEENNEEALAGLAECYWKSGDARLEETLQRLRRINPNHLQAAALEVESRLDLGEAEPALEIIRKAREINPVHLRLRALEASAYFLKDDLESMRRTQEEALRFNPYGSEVYSTPARIASRHYRFREAAELGEKALSVNPDDHEARANYARDLLRLGREEEGRKQLDLAFAARPYDAQLFNLLNLLDSLRRFESVEQGPFVLQLPKAEVPILADDALALLREAYEANQAKYRMTIEAPVHVQIFDDHDDFMVRSVGLPGSIGFMGICFGRLITMDSPSARPKGTMNWRSVLWHEFAHVVTLQKTGHRLPRWLSEGFSVYEETQRSPAWGQKLDIQYKPIIRSEPLPGLADLERYFIQPKTSLHVMLGYFFAAEFVSFYAKTFGFDAVRQALDRIAAGSRAEKALVEAAGASEEAVNEGFQKHLNQRLAPLDNLPDIHPPETEGEEPDRRPRAMPVTDWLEQPSPFTDALRHAEQAWRERRFDDAERCYLEADSLFPEYTGENAPLQRLINLYEEQDKTDQLKNALRRAIGRNATDLSACKKLLALHRQAEEWDAAVEVAREALGIDPWDVEIRKILLEGYIRTGDLERALIVANQLTRIDAPHRTDYRLTRIDLLGKQGRWEQAKRENILLLEEYPHFWQAQQSLLSIVERTGAGE
ncbi:MAG: hypothetical protein ACE15F_06150 [bacterium]